MLFTFNSGPFALFLVYLLLICCNCSLGLLCGLKSSTSTLRHKVFMNSGKHASVPFTLRNAGAMRDSFAQHKSYYTGTVVQANNPSALNVLLRWKTPPKRILVLSKLDSEIIPSVADAIKHLTQLGKSVIVEPSLHDALGGHVHDSQRSTLEQLTRSTSGLDLVVTFGGDGLLLHCNALFGQKSMPPVMSFDFGSLGFLSPFLFEDFDKEMDAVLHEELMLTLRMRLDCAVIRNGVKADTYTVLNEAVIDRGPSPYLSVLDLACDAQYITTLQGDGIIFATPTGSTAYSLSAGGSVMYPSVPAILITPICAHSLSFRPLVLPDAAVLTCAVPLECRSSGWVSFDGKFRQELERGDKLEVRTSIYPMPTVNRKSFTADWMDSLRDGFMFNLRRRQRGHV